MKLFLSDELGYDENKARLLSEFILFCAKELPIENDFNIHVVAKRKPYGISTTAVYEVGNNCCKIYGKNRAFVDVLRSIAHEMTHMMQDEMGLLVGHIQDAGGFHEDQANSKAGELIKLFAKSKEDRKAIYESRYNNNNKTLTSYNKVFEGYSKLNPKFQGANVSLGDFGEKTDPDSPGGDNFGRADVEGDKFTLGGIQFVAMPTPDVASKAEALVASAKASASAAGDKYDKTWETSKSGKNWLRSHMWNNAPAETIKMKPGSGNYQDRPSGCAKGLGKKYTKTANCTDATDARRAWSGNFWKRSHENYIEPKKSDGGNGISNLQSEYNWADAARVRKRVFANPDAYKGKVVWMVFKPSEGVPINRGDSVVTDLFKIKSFDKMHTSNYKGIAASGNSHMNVITADGGGSAVGGNLSNMAKSGRSKGLAYYKRVKVLGRAGGDKKEVQKENKINSYNQISEGYSKLAPRFAGANVSLGDFGEKTNPEEAGADFLGSGNFKQLSNWPSPSPVNEDASSMSASKQIVDDIKRSEGFIPHVYDDLAGTKAKRAGLAAYENAKGTPTIGYGEAIFWKKQKDKAEKYRPYLKGGGKKMSESEASRLLMKSIRKHTRIIRSGIKVPITQNMFDALTSYCYNTGPAGIKKFKNSSGESILDLINKKNYVGAAKVIQSKPTKGRQQGGGSIQLKGLVRRREREANIFATGAQKLSQGLSEISGENILLAGDSQIGGALGQYIAKVIGIPVASRVYKNGADGNKIASLIKPKIGSASQGVIISFGGNNRAAGIDALINTVKTAPVYKTNPKKIVILGPPPAFNPTDYNYTKKVFGSKYDPGKYQTRYKDRKEYNKKIESAVTAAGMTFFSPYDYIGSEKSGGKDGIHLNNRLAKKFIDAIKKNLPKKKSKLSESNKINSYNKIFEEGYSKLNPKFQGANVSLGDMDKSSNNNDDEKPTPIGDYLVQPNKGLYAPVLEKYKNNKSKNRYPKPNHPAYDWAMPEGSPYFAVADGVVTSAKSNNSWQKKFKWYKGSVVYDNFPGMKKQSMSITSGPKDMKGLSGLSPEEKASWQKAKTAKKGSIMPKEFNKGGNGISIKHIHPTTKQPFYTYCGHLKDVYVKKGDKVKGGQVIGTCGSTGRSTGPHFHWKLKGFEGSKASDKSAYDRFLARCSYVKEK